MLIVTSEVLQISEIWFFEILKFNKEHTRNIVPAAIEGGVFSDTKEYSSALLQVYLHIVNIFCPKFNLEQNRWI